MKARKLAVSAVIGAAYAALTVAGAGWSYGPVQFRISEALCVLPFFAPGTVWGLFAGCVIANIFSPTVNVFDIVFGSLATLTAGYLTSKIKNKWLAPLPPVIINGIVVGAVLAYILAPENFWQSYALFGAQVALGELTVCYLLGMPAIYAIEKNKFLRNILNGGSLE